MNLAPITYNKRRGATTVRPRRVRMDRTDRRQSGQGARRLPEAASGSPAREASAARVLRRWSVAELMTEAVARAAAPAACSV